MIKKLLLLLIALFQTSYLFALNKADFEDFREYSLKWLEEHRNAVDIHENESGFVRIAIPFQSETYPEIGKLRLNYWHRSTPIEKETVHSHPQYFESSIIAGSYQHELFEEGEEGELVKAFLITKGDAKRVPKQLPMTHIKSIRIEKISEGELAVFPTDLLHRIIETSPIALSINAVFTCDEITYIKTYRGKDFPSETIDTKRHILSTEESEKVLDEVISLLSTASKSNDLK